MKMLESSLNSVEGRWISQRTIYYFDKRQIESKKIYIDIKKIEDVERNNETDTIIYSYKYIYENQSSIVYNYIINTRSIGNCGIISKISNKTKKQYEFIFYNKCLKIQYIKDSTMYTEYAYLINSRFKISVVIIKHNNNYVAISYNSDIKIKDKKN